MRTLKALVLFSVLSSEWMAFRMPTMMASTTISPTEQTVKDKLEMRLRDREVSLVCSSALWIAVRKLMEHRMKGSTHVLSPPFTSARDCLTSGRSRASPGKAAVQKVRTHWYVMTAQIVRQHRGDLFGYARPST